MILCNHEFVLPPLNMNRFSYESNASLISMNNFNNGVQKFNKKSSDLEVS
jgi:hypothetical protein